MNSEVKTFNSHLMPQVIFYYIVISIIRDSEMVVIVVLYRNLTVNSERTAKCSLSPSASPAAASTLSLSIIKQYNYHPVSQSVILPHG